MLSFQPGIAQNKAVLDRANAIVLVPGEMKLYTDTILTAIGEIIYFTYVSKDSLLQYELSYCEYPEGTLHSDSTELLKEFFSTTISVTLEKLKGKQRYASEILQFGFPGWFWRIDYGKDRYTKYKAFVAGRNYYNLQVTGSKNQDLETLSTKYFDSFQFMDLKQVRK